MAALLEDPSSHPCPLDIVCAERYWVSTLFQSNEHRCIPHSCGHFPPAYSNITAAKPATPARAFAATVAIGAIPEPVAEEAAPEAALSAELTASDALLAAEPIAEEAEDAAPETADDADEPAPDTAEEALPAAPLASEAADEKMVVLPIVLVIVLPSVVMVVRTGRVVTGISPPAAPPVPDEKMVVLPRVVVIVLPSVVMVETMSRVVIGTSPPAPAPPEEPPMSPDAVRAEVAARALPEADEATANH
jgi:hypothetical protein